MKNKLFIGLTLAASLLMFGCQQVNDLVNGNKAANSNAAANTNATSNANSNAAATSNANTNDKNSNATVENSNASTEPTGTPKPPEVKAFENKLLGTWTDATERVVFSKDEIKFYNRSYDSNKATTWKYNAVDEKTLDITNQGGKKSKATMTFEDNNTTLIWNDEVGNFRYKRESDKP